MGSAHTGTGGPACPPTSSSLSVICLSLSWESPKLRRWLLRGALAARGAAPWGSFLPGQDARPAVSSPCTSWQGRQMVKSL